MLGPFRKYLPEVGTSELLFKMEPEAAAKTQLINNGFRWNKFKIF